MAKKIKSFWIIIISSTKIEENRHQNDGYLVLYSMLSRGVFRGGALGHGPLWPNLFLTLKKIRKLGLPPPIV